MSVAVLSSTGQKLMPTQADLYDPSEGQKGRRDTAD